MKKYIRLNPVKISVITIFCGILFYLFGISALDRLELDIIDLRFKLRGTVKPNSDIVLAVIDEKSIKKEGKWIWPRVKMAELVTKLSDAGAKVIAFDIGFLEQDQTYKYNLKIIDKIEKYIERINKSNENFKNYLEELKIQMDQDKTMSNAIKKSNAKVVLGYFFHTFLDNSDTLDESAMEVHKKNIAGSKYKIVTYTPDYQYGYMMEGIIPQSNIQIISEASNYAGHFNMEPDLDGVVRHIPLAIRFQDELYASLSLMSASAYLNEQLYIRLDNGGVQSINIGTQEIPVDDDGNLFINYYGQSQTFEHISVTDILNDNIKPDKLKDKIVMVGATAVGIYDMRVTPFDSIFPGLEIHANILANILSNHFLKRPEWILLVDMITILFSGVFLCITLPRVQILGGTLITSILTISYLIVNCYFFNNYGILMNIIYPVATIFIIYMGISVYNFFLEGRQKKFIKDAFAHYLAPSVVKQLIESPGGLELGGHERNITAFFSDVQGFTSISEKLTPSEIGELLNEFLTEMTDVILEYQGTVDKFEGDAIIAFFGAPNHIENHGQVACIAAVKMQNKLAELREKWRKAGKPEMKMRIGMCTGNAVVGNMGSKNRMDYTMIGDTVNTAARLEGANKFYGTYILVSETTCQDAEKASIVTRELDLFIAVGKKEPIKIYELVGFEADIDEKTREGLAYYVEGVSAYRDQQWDKAINFFEDTLSLIPDDSPSKTMIDRCKEFKKNAPGENWNGVFFADKK